MPVSRPSDPATALLHSLEIPIPCTQSWDAMAGDERIRHCGLCRKNVYNLSAMPRAEAAALLAGDADGELCVRFYRRSDGTVMTSDCGASPRVKLHRAMRVLPRVAAGAAGMAGTAAVAVAVAHTTPGQLARSAPKSHVVEVALLVDPQAMGAHIDTPPMPEPVILMGARTAPQERELAAPIAPVPPSPPAAATEASPVMAVPPEEAPQEGGRQAAEGEAESQPDATTASR